MTKDELIEAMKDYPGDMLVKFNVRLAGDTRSDYEVSKVYLVEDYIVLSIYD